MGKKVRIYDLARELNLSNKEVLDLLRDLGVEVKSHSSTIEEKDAQALKELLQEGTSPPPPPEVPALSHSPLEELEEELLEKVEEVLGERRRADGRRRRERVWEPRREVAVEEKEEAAPPVEEEKVIELTGDVSIRDLARLLEVPPKDILATLMATGAITSINQTIDPELAAIVAEQYGKKVVLKPPEPEVAEEAPPPVEERSRRQGPVAVPPIVTVLGHVDHGKTTLLDTIRRTHVAEQEEGGITQHIGAYEVEWKGRSITFIDTPGHEAFTAMRARGAQVTDIAVLVVAADDGVMPQTREAIHHAQAAKVPLLVAINKIDLPTANPERVKQQLADIGLIPEEWGGETIVVPLSAKTGQGVEDLLEMILLLAEMEGLRGDPRKPAEGVVIESSLQKGQGPVATLLVLDGTLRRGDFLVVGTAYGRVRQMLDHLGRPVKEAGPSKPVQVIGLSEVPEVGTKIEVVEDERTARRLAEERREQLREKQLQRSQPSLESLLQRSEEGKKVLHLILKADVVGSLEAIGAAIARLSNEEVSIEILHTGVGAITQSDVLLAEASKALIVGFRVGISGADRQLAEGMGVQIKQYNLIYDLLEGMRELVSGMLEPRWEEIVLGHAQVLQVFRVARFGQVAGCRVVDGRLVRGEKVRVARQGSILFEGRLDSLRRVQEDVLEVPAGQECGVGLLGFNEFQPGDILECYTMQEVRRTP